MTETQNRSFDWIVALAFLCGAAVIVPSLIVLAVSLVTAGLHLF